MEDLSKYLNKSIIYDEIEYYVHRCYPFSSELTPYRENNYRYYLYASRILSDKIKIEIPEFVPIIQHLDYIYCLEVNVIDLYIFIKNPNIKSITFPKSIEYFDDLVFTVNCHSLKEIIIKENFSLKYKFTTFIRSIKYASSLPNTLNNLKLIKFNNISLIKENNKWKIKRI